MILESESLKVLI